MGAFKVSVLTPSQILVKNLEVSELFVPTVRGEFNILPEHTHLVTQLGPGIITLKTADGDEHFLSTTGVCKVLKDQVTILTQTSERASHVDRDRAQAALEKARLKLSGEEALSDEELLKYQRKLNRADLRLKMHLLGK